MARSTYVVEIGTVDKAALRASIENFLCTQGFLLMDYKGERCYKKGTGALVEVKFIKIDFGEFQVLISAWSKKAVSIGPEFDLERYGQMQFAKKFKAVIASLQMHIETFVNMHTTVAAVPTAANKAGFCPNCGAAILEKYNFCRSCGGKL